ncbi:peptidase S41 family protein [Magnaporthiopsis poae ATCC 64411]|uniref:Peptidase S41 family protein n=1 Tax=Magnaporthiopsis poae (strain ATCC 64411 / 73-15) TaxID=644358 RepID=A0A0C4EFD9_MAGP6|nr:peptidase S41 family protein [Magnaporthiopsis poae ATCC 64411]
MPNMKSSVVALGLLLGAVYAVPAPSAGGEPCEKIAPAAAEYMAANPNATNPMVPARMAWECLQTIPNKVGPAQDMIRSLKAFVNWQSTLAFLKAPPRDYMLPPTDIQQGLDDIAAGVEKGRYKSEYDFQMAIVELIFTAHDGHFNYRPDALKAFSFRNTMAADIVSVSRDGRSAPMLYHEGAIRAAMNGTRGNSTSGRNNGTFQMPPAIIQINGQDAISYTENLNLKYSSFQDPDSQWNSYVRSYSNPQGSPVIAASLAYMGPTLTLAYEDGTIKTSENMAILRTGINFTGIRSGEDFYDRWCTPNKTLAEMSNVALEVKQVVDPTPTSPDESPFLYQAANCRIWYTPQTVMDPAANWKAVVDATWADPKKYCVADSIVSLEETGGGGQPMDPLFQLNVDEQQKTAGAVGAAGRRASWVAGGVGLTAALAVLVL